MGELTPYMQVDNDKIITFDKHGAKDAGVSKPVIKAGREFVEMNNEMIQITVEDNNLWSDRINQTKIHKFEKFFEAVQRGETGSVKEVAATGDNMWGLVQYASAAAGDVCGGQQSNPHPAPEWIESGTYRSTHALIVSYVTGQGYHQTAGYASGYNAEDYTKGVSGYGCASPIFRDQRIIHASGAQWTFSQQGHTLNTPFGEPNPEVLGYIWPVYWWGTYVQWWHQHF